MTSYRDTTTSVIFTDYELLVSLCEEIDGLDDEDYLKQEVQLHGLTTLTRTAERPVAINEHDKRRRAELAAELGWYPADLDEESIARHRADAARKKTDRDPAKKWAHLTELARQREVEAKGRAQVADLYE